MTDHKSIFQDKRFYIGMAERAIKTGAQAGVAAVSVALFTSGAGALAFFLIVAVAVVTSVLTSFAKPEAVIRGATPVPVYEEQLDH